VDEQEVVMTGQQALQRHEDQIADLLERVATLEQYRIETDKATAKALTNMNQSIWSVSNMLDTVKKGMAELRDRVVGQRKPKEPPSLLN
jgi:hypothetical protein